MWDLQTIRHINREVGDVARAQGKKPYLIMNVEQLDLMPPFPFPNIGDDCVEVDKQYESIEEIMCDKTGLDNAGPALSPDQLNARLRELLEENPDGIRVAIVEEGQFQLFVGVWR
tara:strand:- start:2361 stop:2705 length:345 start_codon:yes stop_codon:yes gene_type:complete